MARGGSVLPALARPVSFPDTLRRPMLRALALAALWTSAAAAQTRPVTFEVVVPGVLAPLDTVYLAGTMNGWNPGDMPDNGDALPMAPAGPNRFRLTVDVAGDSVAYKYTLGSWPSVEMTADDRERDNRLLGTGPVARDTVQQWLIPSVARGAWRAFDLLPMQDAALVAWLPGSAFNDTLSTDAAVDALLAGAEAAWADAATRLGVPAVPLLPSVVAGLGSGPGVGRLDRVMQTVVVPRQRALLATFEGEPVHPSHIRAIGWMSYHLLELPLRAIPDAATADAARRDGPRIATLAGRYCAEDFGVRGGTSACQIRERALALNALWTPVAASLHGDFPGATAGFTALVHAGLETSDVPTLVRDLALAHVRRAPRADALATLDALLTGTTDRYTDVDSLRAAYVRADPAGGSARAERLLPGRPVLRLDTLAGAPRLAGLVMPDVVTRSAFSFDDVAGRLVLLDVWATWCGPCIAEIPTFNALHGALATRTDVAFVSVLDDARAGGMLPQDAEAFVAEHGVGYPALYDLGDDGLGAALAVWAYPSKFLVYPDGSVRAIPLDMDWRAALRLATDELGLPPVGAD